MPSRARKQNHWNEDEDDVLRDLYPAGGVSACIKKLPHRSPHAIQGRAQHIGLKSRLSPRHVAALAAVDPRPLAAALNGWTVTAEELRL